MSDQRRLRRALADESAAGGHRPARAASGAELAYEVLNFADGKRTARQIRDAVSAEYGPVPLEQVIEYLRALEAISLVLRVQ